MCEMKEWTNELVDAHVSELCAKGEQALQEFLDLDQEAVDYIVAKCLSLIHI